MKSHQDSTFVSMSLRVWFGSFQAPHPSRQCAVERKSPVLDSKPIPRRGNETDYGFDLGGNCEQYLRIVNALCDLASTTSSFYQKSVTQFNFLVKRGLHLSLREALGSMPALKQDKTSTKG